jgi:DNA modification methylase
MLSKHWKVNGYYHEINNADCRDAMEEMLYTGMERTFHLIYADMIYDDFDFSWLKFCKRLLTSNGSVFVQTDYRSVAELKLYMDDLFSKDNFVNWIIWPYDWGGRPKNAFGRKHDDILWYSKTTSYKFYPENVQIPKRTSGSSALNPSGRDTKTPTDVWQDVGNFHTMSSERISDVRWQKPERLIQRIVDSVTVEGDYILDPFMGSGTTMAVCMKSNRNSIGIEIDSDIYKKAKERLENVVHSCESQV